jgi:hypothetical protein
MSDTPRTDAAEASAPDYATPEYIHSDFVRQLERELNKAKADADALAEALEEIVKRQYLGDDAITDIASKPLKSYRTKYQP